MASEPIDGATTNIINRLKSIEGHVRGIERMVDKGEYCVDVVNQILAVQRALHKVNGLVLERHLYTCVTTAIRGDDPDERERVIGEIMGVFDAMGKL
jgi:DNA-binding FrmR family transcriptional regulator